MGYLAIELRCTCLLTGVGCCSDERFILQASIANNGFGRSQPIHTRIHGKSEGEWVKAQALFLDELTFIFFGYKNEYCCDNRFWVSSPWFKNIQRLGWHYIGRVRGIVKVLCESTGQWTTVDELYQQANRLS